MRHEPEWGEDDVHCMYCGVRWNSRMDGDGSTCPGQQLWAENDPDFEPPRREPMREPDFIEALASMLSLNPEPSIDSGGAIMWGRDCTSHPSPGKERYTFSFPNGFGASVIRCGGSYGGDDGLWELAVLRGEDLCYDTEITSGVLGWLEGDDVEALLQRISELKEAN